MGVLINLPTRVTIALSSDHLHAIYAHAERTYPNECCGLLVGRLGSDGKDDKQVVELRPAQNAWQPDVADDLAEAPDLSKSDRYWIAPEELLAAMRFARQNRWDVIGIYHSHPDHPAVPSECDRRLAWPQYSYLIVSVEQGSAKICRSWVLDDHHQFQPEDLQIVDSVDSAERS